MSYQNEEKGSKMNEPAPKPQNEENSNLKSLNEPAPSSVNEGKDKLKPMNEG